jgi:hypothetical protein
MKRKATINNPYHRHHSAPGGRKRVQEKVGVSDTVRINRFAEGTQIPVIEVSEPGEEDYEIEIDLNVLLIVLISTLIVLAECFLPK